MQCGSASEQSRQAKWGEQPKRRELPNDLQFLPPELASVQLLRGGRMLLIVSSIVLLFLIALGVSQRFRSLVARHRLSFAVALLGLAGVIVFALLTNDYFSVDACLDSGGRWDKEQEVCQHEEQPNVPR